jgi:hypothetical protein
MANKRKAKADLFRTLHPEDILTFVEMHGFGDDWKDLRLDDDDLHALQVLIMVQPAAVPVLEGSGGLRKIRFAPSRWRVGKGGAARVCYVYFQEWQTVLLVTAYSKDEQDDIPPAHLAAYRQVIERIKREFGKRHTP